MTEARKSAAAKKTAATKPGCFREWAADADAAIQELCAWVTGGGHLAEFCRNKGLAYPTVSAWVYASQTRAGMYARAREERADKLADEIVAIADEAEGGDAAAIQRNRLRVDARKWAASKLKPRVYGDKLDIVQTSTVRDVSDQALLGKLKELGIDPAMVKLINPQEREGS